VTSFDEAEWKKKDQVLRIGTEVFWMEKTSWGALAKATAGWHLNN
jgi:hypothetical protein